MGPNSLFVATYLTTRWCAVEVLRKVSPGARSRRRDGAVLGTSMPSPREESPPFSTPTTYAWESLIPFLRSSSGRVETPLWRIDAVRFWRASAFLSSPAFPEGRALSIPSRPVCAAQMRNKSVRFSVSQSCSGLPSFSVKTSNLAPQKNAPERGACSKMRQCPNWNCCSEVELILPRHYAVCKEQNVCF